MSGDWWWVKPGSLVEYARSKAYPLWFRRRVPRELSESPRYYQSLVSLVPGLSRLRGECGYSYRRLSDYARDCGVNAGPSTLRRFLMLHGLTECSELFRADVVKFLDELSLSGSAGLSSFRYRWTYRYGSTLLTLMGFRCRTMADLVEAVRLLDGICFVKEVPKFLRCSTKAATRLFRENPDLLELLAERRRRFRDDGLEVPSFLLRSATAAKVLLMLVGRSLTLREITSLLGWGMGCRNMNRMRLRELIECGLVSRYMDGGADRYAYRYVLTAAGYRAALYLLDVLGSSIGGGV